MKIARKWRISVSCVVGGFFKANELDPTIVDSLDFVHHSETTLFHLTTGDYKRPLTVGNLNPLWRRWSCYSLCVIVMSIVHHLSSLGFIAQMLHLEKKIYPNTTCQKILPSNAIFVHLV